VDWRIRARDERKRRATPPDVKAQTLVLMFPLAAARPSAAEEKRLAGFENDLDAQLRVPSLEAPYFGSYEGNDIHDRAYRMFLTTPDVARLEQKLAPWLQGLEWARPVTVVKRFGRIADTDAREEFRTFE
jgi:hypothetical protein